MIQDRLQGNGLDPGQVQTGGDWTVVIPTSVTRLGDLLDFGQVFKAFGNN